MKKVNESDEMSFEEAMAQLEEIVQQLEAGEVPLEESIQLFQRGMELSKYCQGKLQHVEKQINLLMEENGQVTAKPFTLQEE